MKSSSVELSDRSPAELAQRKALAYRQAHQILDKLSKIGWDGRTLDVTSPNANRYSTRQWHVYGGDKSSLTVKGIDLAKSPGRRSWGRHQKALETAAVDAFLDDQHAVARSFGRSWRNIEASERLIV